MSLLTDLIGYVNSFRIDQTTKYDAASNALLNSIDFPSVMVSAAQQGQVYVKFPLTSATIDGMYETIKDVKNIEEALMVKLRVLYPDITFYNDKYKELHVYGQWEILDLRKPTGPIG